MKRETKYNIETTIYYIIFLIGLFLIFYSLFNIIYIKKISEAKLKEETTSIQEKAKINNTKTEKELYLEHIRREDKDGKIYLDLDISFNFIDYDPIKGQNGVYAQDWINDDYITYTCGDFYHHNTPRFLECFWNFDKVDYIIINNVHYKFVEYTTGYTDFEFNVVRLEDGTNTERNNVIEFITCQGEPYSYHNLNEWESKGGLRYIAVLEEIEE